MAAVSSQPKPPGVYSVLRSALKCSKKPREPLYGLPKTPKKTVPSGATIGEAVPSSRTPALLALLLRGSFSATSYLVASVVLSNPSRYGDVYSVAPLTTT